LKNKPPTSESTTARIPSSFPKALILSAGTGSRWDGPESKQLARVDGETLLHRTVRLLRERGVDDVSIVSWDPAHSLPRTTTVFSPPSERIVDTMDDVRAHFSDDTLLLLGDVFYTRGSIERMLRSRTPLAFFGRDHGSIILTGCQWAEIFAVRFAGTGVAEFERRLATAVANHENRGKLWDVHGAGADPAALIDLEDYVEDFDTVLGYRRWLWRYRVYRALPIRVVLLLLRLGQKAEPIAQALYWRTPWLFRREVV